MNSSHSSAWPYVIAFPTIGIAVIVAYATYSTDLAHISEPEFGDNVVILDPSMPSEAIQDKLDNIFKQQESNQFGNERYAILFKPGTYQNKVKLGFYTQVMGLGQMPDDVTIDGGVQVEASWFHNDATQNFWRALENLTVVPASGTMQWAVAQASPMRRTHIRGNMLLDDNGWSSGGFIADSQIDQQIDSGMQQQWLTRNSHMGSWTGSNWNMVFVGDKNPPASAKWPEPAYTVIDQTPVVREKPFLTIDSHGHYEVFVPALRKNSQGVSWDGRPAEGKSISIDSFYIAKADIDTAATINAALAKGKHLLLTPGIYKLDRALRVRKPDTIVLGLGIATLQPTTGQAAMTVDDVSGVKLAGLLFDAGLINSPVLLQIGPAESRASHVDNPTSLHDVFFRIGGAGPANATLSLQINSHNVIADDLWVWRADHGTGVGWDINKTINGLVVNGNHVTIYGLAVEHFHQYQTVWNGDSGSVYFYQSEIPYDVPDQASWKNGEVNGYASYKVADTVTSHAAWGVGIYCFFDTNPTVKLHSAIEVPDNEIGLNGAMFNHITSVSLGGTGEISHVINSWGDSANASNHVIRLAR